MSEGLVLLDLPSRHEGGSICWSPNTWKSRLALNFKGVEYTTRWVEYVDIASTLKSLSVSPNPGGPTRDFTLPAVQFPDGSCVMESQSIAEKLEQFQPSPSLRIDNGYTAQVNEAIEAVKAALGPELLPYVPKKLLKQASVGYFEETREKRFGMTLDQLSRSDKAGETAWAAANPGLEQLKALLKTNQSGPFVEGTQASYADLLIAAYLEFTRLANPEKVFSRLMNYDDSFKTHYSACEQWVKRNQY